MCTVLFVALQEKNIEQVSWKECSLLVCAYFLVADTLRENFEQYGEVTECNIMKDPISKRSRSVLMELVVELSLPRISDVVCCAWNL